MSMKWVDNSHQLVIFFYNQIKKKKRKMWAPLLIITILTSSVSGYAIEGSWKVVDILDTTLPERYFIKAEIKNFVFRNTNIRWTLSFTGCQTFKYMMQVRDNNLYIDTSTLYIDNKVIQNCSDQSIRYENQLRLAIKKTFSFKMVYYLMAFLNPQNNPVIKFERIVSNNTDRNKIQGAWMINVLFSRNMAEMIQIYDKKIIYCQKQAEADYKSTNNKVQITETRPNSCRNNQLLKAFNGTLYFVKRNATLQMYNANDELVTSLTYITDIQGLKKMREQQQKNKINNPPPPPPPPMMSQNTNFLPPNRIPMPQAQAQYPVDKYFGKWSVTKILGESNIPKKTELVITNNTIIISNECMSYIQSYIKQSDTPFKIKRKTLRQMPSSCKNEDNSIYKNSLTKTSLLRLSVEGNLLVVRTFDLTGKEMLTLTRNNDLIQPLQPLPPPPNLFNNNFPPSPSPQNDPNTLSQGKYTILLLLRREIPRKIVNIKDNSFKITLCNEYLISLQLNAQKEIKIRTVKTKQNSCDLTIQKLFLDSFNSAATFNHDEQDTIIMKDKNNNEVVTLNLVG